MRKGRFSQLGLIFVAGWLLSFASGCTVKLAYEFFNTPAWLNSVVVGLFVGLTCFFMSLAVITSSFNFDWRIATFENKVKAISGLVFGFVFFFASLFVFWKVFLNFQALFM